MILTLLGTQGWIPTGRRETTCLAVADEGRLLVFDAGTGLRRLLEPPGATMLAEARELHLFLTHYHLDHVCGLSYVPGIFAGRRLAIHVPEMSISGVDPEKGIAELLRKPYFPHPVVGSTVTVDALCAGNNTVAGHNVRIRAQQHPDITVGYRVDDLFAFTTDTVADPETATFAAGAELLLHEAWIDGREEEEPGREELVRAAYAAHTSARQAAALAAQAGVAELFLIHLNPLFGEDYYRQMEASARAIFPPTSVHPDLHRCGLGARRP